MLYSQPKLANEVLKCRLDMSAWVNANRTVQSFAVTTSQGALVANGAYIEDNIFGVWTMSGGTPGEISHVRLTATMSDGQVFAEKLVVPVYS